MLKGSIGVFAEIGSIPAVANDERGIALLHEHVSGAPFGHDDSIFRDSGAEKCAGGDSGCGLDCKLHFSLGMVVLLLLLLGSVGWLVGWLVLEKGIVVGWFVGWWYVC